MKNQLSERVIIILFAIIIASAIILNLWKPINKAVNERTVTVSVTDKNVKRSDDDDKYLIYTLDEDGETQVFEITDSLLKWRWNSSDLYAKIEVGNTYKFTICGYRWRFMSIYPNIYKIKMLE